MGVADHVRLKALVKPPGHPPCLWYIMLLSRKRRLHSYLQTDVVLTHSLAQHFFVQPLK